MRAEHSMLEAFAGMRRATFFSRVRIKLFREMGHEPASLRIFAQCKEAYRAFARWVTFKRKL